MKVKVYDNITDSYVTFELPSDFSKQTMLYEIPNEDDEIIELPKEKVTYNSLLYCINDPTSFDILIQTFKTYDFLGIQNDDLIERISQHKNFDPSKLGYLSFHVIKSKKLNSKNTELLSNYIGYDIEIEENKIKKIFVDIKDLLISKMSDLQDVDVKIIKSELKKIVSDKDIIKLFVTLYQIIDNTNIYNLLNFLICNKTGMIVFNHRSIYSKLNKLKIYGIDIMSFDEFVTTDDNFDDHVDTKSIVEMLKSVNKNKITIIGTSLMDPLFEIDIVKAFHPNTIYISCKIYVDID